MKEEHTFETGQNERGGVLGWLFTWRVWRVVVFAAVLTATLIGLYYAQENWRGRRAWNKYKAQLISEGVQLDLAALIPPEIPAESNFAHTPFLISVFPKRGKDPNRWPALYDQVLAKVGATGKARGDRELTDVFAWQLALRQARNKATNDILLTNTNQAAKVAAATEFLEAFSIYDDVVKELRGVMDRPDARYPVKYDMENPWGILLPHLAVMKSLCTFVALRSSMELAKGDVEEAFQDVLLLFALTESLRNEPFLISYLVRIACINITSQPVWEGMRQHLWKEKHLLEFQRRLERMNYIESIGHSIASEQAAGNVTFELFRRSKDAMSLLNALTGNANIPKLKFNPIPRGWSYFEQVNFHRIYQATVRKGFNEKSEIISPDEVEANSEALQQSLNKPFGGIFHHIYVARLLIPAIGKIQKRAAEGQTLVHQLRLACALENYFLAHRNYPKNLADIARDFGGRVPHDVITGSPMLYRKAEGGYTLYSLGWNNEDNGGVAGKSRWSEDADWIWRL